MNRLVILGSSSGMPDPKRACSSILIESGIKSYLLDAGEGCASSILRHKVDSDKIKQVFITHTHSDHSIGIFMLVQMMHLLGRKENLEIYLPEESIFWFENMFDAVYLFSEGLNFKFELKPIPRDFVFKDESLVLRSYPNQHLLSNKEFISEQGLPNKMESHCFLIEMDKRKIVYSGDIAKSEDIEDLIQGVDYLLCESTHIDLEELFELVSARKVKSTILTHIYEETEKKKEFLIKVAQKLGCQNLQFASDGLNIDIS
jgi:ribonuclease Z